MTLPLSCQTCASALAISTVLGLLAAMAETPSYGQVAKPTYSVTRTEDRITIDGELSEGAWTSARKIANLTQRQPNPGQAPTE